MKTRNYIRSHEACIQEALKAPLSPADREKLLELHDKMIGMLQHERLIHLIVLLAVVLFMLIALGICLFRPTIPLMVATGLLLGLSVGYIVHYYRLENSVQRWYGMRDKIAQRPISNRNKS